MFSPPHELLDWLLDIDKKHLLSCSDEIADLNSSCDKK